MPRVKNNRERDRDEQAHTSEAQDIIKNLTGE